MMLTNVAWAHDHRGRCVLELKMDGHPAHSGSSQKSELLRRGIVEGVVLLASERRKQAPNIYIRGDFGPELTQRDLIGCTDDPQVFALYEEMCRAIWGDSWRPGSRP